MYALPSRRQIDSGASVTGVACPDCGGVIGIALEGQENHPSFECRVGHRFALVDLLTSKEERLEERLWAALVGVEELVALLRDIAAAPTLLATPGASERFRERIARGESMGRRLRELIESDGPVDLTLPPSVSPDGPP